MCLFRRRTSSHRPRRSSVPSVPGYNIFSYFYSKAPTMVNVKIELGRESMILQETNAILLPPIKSVITLKERGGRAVTTVGAKKTTRVAIETSSRRTIRGAGRTMESGMNGWLLEGTVVETRSLMTTNGRVLPKDVGLLGTTRIVVINVLLGVNEKSILMMERTIDVTESENGRRNLLGWILMSQPIRHLVFLAVKVRLVNWMEYRHGKRVSRKRNPRTKKPVSRHVLNLRGAPQSRLLHHQ